MKVTDNDGFKGHREREILIITISRAVVPTTRCENGHDSSGVLGIEVL
jgi:hypothetical protein